MKGIAIFALAAAALLCGCGDSGSGANFDSSQQMRAVTLPDGAEVKAEVEISTADMAKGMMYRTSLPADHGMLFVHGGAGSYPYWMANCKIALDIIWMDSSHKVVEISAKTPPCPDGGSGCPNYGGHTTAQYVLELGAGEAARHQVKQGSILQF